MKCIAVFIFVLMISCVPAWADEFEDQVRKIYVDLAALMSENEIDIPALMEFTDKYNADDLKSYSDLLHAKSGKWEDAVFSKKEILAAIPVNYGKMIRNHADIEIKKYIPVGPWSATVEYEMKYQSEIKLKDRIGRNFTSVMHLYTTCTDALHRSAKGYPQIARSHCRGAVSYGLPRYKSWHE